MTYGVRILRGSFFLLLASPVYHDYWQPLFRLLGMVEIKHNTTKCSLQASLFSIGYHWPDMRERWFNSKPATFKIGGRKSHCIMCFKGESRGGGCWNQEGLRSQTLCSSHTDAPANGLLLLSLLWQSIQAAFIFFPHPSSQRLWMIYLCLLFKWSPVMLNYFTYYIYLNIWIKDKSQKRGFGQFEFLYILSWMLDEPVVNWYLL